jgi:hypothetical protein
MKAGYALLLGLAAILAGCTATEHTTDKQAAMARMTFTPGQKCEDGQGAASTCGNDHAAVPSSLRGRDAFE